MTLYPCTKPAHVLPELKIRVGKENKQTNTVIKNNNNKKPVNDRSWGCGYVGDLALLIAGGNMKRSKAVKDNVGISSIFVCGIAISSSNSTSAYIPKDMKTGLMWILVHPSLCLNFFQ